MMLRKQNLILRGISLFLAGAFFVSDACWAISVNTPNFVSLQRPQELILKDPFQFETPAEYSTLKEIHKGNKNIFIIHIQDAHSNFSGQKNLANCLEEIMTKYKVQIVLSEGASIEATLDPLKEKISKKDLPRVAKTLLMEGLIAGDEYENLISDKPMRIIGIEDLDLYVRSIENYRVLTDRRQETLRYLGIIRNAVNKLKNKLYPKKLLDYEEIIQKAGKAGNASSGLSFESGLKCLFLLSAKPLDKNYPELARLQALLDQEKGIDFNQVNLEWAALLEKLSKVDHGPWAIDYGEESFEQQLKKSNQFKSSKLSQFSLFEKTFYIACKKNVRVEEYPNLLKYKEYLRQFFELDLEKVLTQRERLEDNMYAQQLAENKDTLILKAIDRYLGILQTAYSIQMTARDFKLFQINEPDFLTAPYLAFLNRVLANQGYFADFVPYTNLLEEGKNALGDFYHSVGQRDLAFMRNSEKVLTEQKQEVAVLISGGYHTQHLTKLFREKGYSYVVLSPKITHETNQKKYEQRLLSFIQKEAKTVTQISGESEEKKSESLLGRDLNIFLKKQEVAVAKLAQQLAMGQNAAEIAERVSKVTGVRSPEMLFRVTVGARMAANEFAFTVDDRAKITHYVRIFLKNNKKLLKGNPEDVLKAIFNVSQLTLPILPRERRPDESEGDWKRDVRDPLRAVHRNLLMGLDPELRKKIFEYKLFGKHYGFLLQRFFILHPYLADEIGLSPNQDFREQNLRILDIQDNSSGRAEDPGAIVYGITFGLGAKKVRIWIKGFGKDSNRRQTFDAKEAQSREVLFYRWVNLTGLRRIAVEPFDEQSDPFSLVWIFMENIPGADTNQIFVRQGETYLIEPELESFRDVLVKEGAQWAALGDALGRGDRQMVKPANKFEPANALLDLESLQAGLPALTPIDHEFLFDRPKRLIESIRKHGRGEIGLLQAFRAARTDAHEMTRLLQLFRQTYLETWQNILSHKDELESMIISDDAFGPGSPAHKSFLNYLLMNPEQRVYEQQVAVVEFLDEQKLLPNDFDSSFLRISAKDTGDIIEHLENSLRTSDANEKKSIFSDSEFFDNILRNPLLISYMLVRLTDKMLSSSEQVAISRLILDLYKLIEPSKAQWDMLTELLLQRDVEPEARILLCRVAGEWLDGGQKTISGEFLKLLAQAVVRMPTTAERNQLGQVIFDALVNSDVLTISQAELDHLFEVLLDETAKSAVGTPQLWGLSNAIRAGLLADKELRLSDNFLKGAIHAASLSKQIPYALGHAIGAAYAAGQKKWGGLLFEDWLPTAEALTAKEMLLASIPAWLVSYADTITSRTMEKFLSWGGQQPALQHGLVDVLLEPLSLQRPDLFNEEIIARLKKEYDPQIIKYILFFISLHETGPPVYDSQHFPFHPDVRNILGGDSAKALIFYNCGKALGDEHIRLSSILSGLLKFNPKLQIELYTAQPWLYRHPRISVKNVNEWGAQKKQFPIEQDKLFDMIVSINDASWWSEIGGEYAKNSSERFLEYRQLHPVKITVDAAIVSGAQPLLNMKINGKEVDVSVSGDPHGNVYAPWEHVAAELGLPFEIGASPRQERIYTGQPDNATMNYWNAKVQSVSESRPIILFNGFGGNRETKGLTLSRYATRVKKLVDNGWHVVLLLNNRSWGGIHVAEKALNELDKLDPEARRHVLVGPESIISPHLPFLVEWADALETTEGFLGHESVAIGRPVSVIPVRRSGEMGRWWPRAIDRHQRPIDDLQQSFDALGARSIHWPDYILNHTYPEDAKPVDPALWKGRLVVEGKVFIVTLREDSQQIVRLLLDDQTGKRVAAATWQRGDSPSIDNIVVGPLFRGTQSSVRLKNLLMHILLRDLLQSRSVLARLQTSTILFAETGNFSSLGIFRLMEQIGMYPNIDSFKSLVDQATPSNTSVRRHAQGITQSVPALELSPRVSVFLVGSDNKVVEEMAPYRYLKNHPEELRYLVSHFSDGDLNIMIKGSLYRIWVGGVPYAMNSTRVKDLIESIHYKNRLPWIANALSRQDARFIERNGVTRIEKGVAVKGGSKIFERSGSRAAEATSQQSPTNPGARLVHEKSQVINSLVLEREKMQALRINKYDPDTEELPEKFGARFAAPSMAEVKKRDANRIIYELLNDPIYALYFLQGKADKKLNLPIPLLFKKLRLNAVFIFREQDGHKIVDVYAIKDLASLRINLKKNTIPIVNYDLTQKVAAVKLNQVGTDIGFESEDKSIIISQKRTDSSFNILELAIKNGIVDPSQNFVVVGNFESYSKRDGYSKFMEAYMKQMMLNQNYRNVKFIFLDKARDSITDQISKISLDRKILLLSDRFDGIKEATLARASETQNLPSGLIERISRNDFAVQSIPRLRDGRSSGFFNFVELVTASMVLNGLKKDKGPIHDRISSYLRRVIPGLDTYGNSIMDGVEALQGYKEELDKQFVYQKLQARLVPVPWNEISAYIRHFISIVSSA